MTQTTPMGATTDTQANTGIPADVATAERVEMAVWAEAMRAVPEAARDALGLTCIEHGAAIAYGARALPIWMFNRVLGLGLGGPVEKDALRKMLDPYREASLPHGVCLVESAHSAEIAAWLHEWGFAQTTTLARMRRGVEALPTPSKDVTIRCVGRDDAELFGATAAAGFGMPEMMVPMFAALPGLDGWRSYLAYDAGRPVATGSLAIQGKIGWLGNGSTLPEYRGRGIHRAMLARRMRDAADLGCKALQTETNFANGDEPTPSLDNMKRVGFEVAYPRPNYVFTP